MTDRDRDAAGRARNARPRDGLGRPLPHGAAGVERLAEGVVRSGAETVDEAQRLLDAGMPFHAHEVFEDAWKAATTAADRAVWKALAQVAVGLTHAARGNSAGAAALLGRGADALEAGGVDEVGRAPGGLDTAAVAAWARSLAAELARPDAPQLPAAVLTRPLRRSPQRRPRPGPRPAAPAQRDQLAHAADGQRRDQHGERDPGDPQGGAAQGGAPYP